MKIRLKFIANSSSSSFICEICSETGTGYEASPSDFDMTYCENGHIICNEHLLNDEEENEDYEVPETSCPICQFQVISNDDVSEYLVETRNITMGEVFNIIKQNNKRRKKLHDYEYINYVFDKCGLTEKLLLDELKIKYASYKDFMNRNKK